MLLDATLFIDRDPGAAARASWSTSPSIEDPSRSGSLAPGTGASPKRLMMDSLLAWRTMIGNGRKKGKTLRLEATARRILQQHEELFRELAKR